MKLHGIKAPIKVNEVSLPKLFRLLRDGKDLPKDALIKNDLWGISVNPFQRRDRNLDRSLMWALTCKEATAAEQDHAVRLGNCGPRRACGSWACVLCRQRDWRRR